MASIGSSWVVLLLALLTLPLETQAAQHASHLSSAEPADKGEQREEESATDSAQAPEGPGESEATQDSAQAPEDAGGSEATPDAARVADSAGGSEVLPDEPRAPEDADELKSSPDATLTPTANGTAESYEATVYSHQPTTPSLPGNRAKTEVTRSDMERRLPRSAPDALRYEPSVFVQQTAHSQGSAFIRGLTGQQTLILFDGVRLNNSAYRQGPNQYFFTLDSQTIESIEVVRGGASTRYGSDALGGVILAKPIEPTLCPAGHPSFVAYEPHIRLRGGTADNEFGGRAQVNLAVGESLAFFGGAGARRVGMLESGGIVTNPDGSAIPMVPRFEDDNRTQRGTGFNEVTGDGRLVYRVNGTNTLSVAAYAYRQYDAPRTDQCPAAFAPYDECLNYDEQFRTLAYATWNSSPGLGLLENVRTTVSWQRQHERRTLSRPFDNVRNIGKDTIDSLGASIVAKPANTQLLPWLRLSSRYGADTYYDRLASAAWISFSDIRVTQKKSRGQYIDGSGYLYGGAFVEGTMRVFSQLRLRAGGRLSWNVARAPANPASGSKAVDKAWFPLVGNAGIEWRPTYRVRLLANVDHSFRAPNLDDLTSRQQTGAGFQFENPNLKPETATTVEVGARIVGRLKAEVWAFRTLVDNAVIKRPTRDVSCPPNTLRCEASWTRLQLVNAEERSEIRGVEVSLFARLPWGFEARTNAAWTWGEGPNVGEKPSDPTLAFQERVPLSRIPPLNGTAEVLWHHESGFSVSGALRWAAKQDRLAEADDADARIPPGGTPGFAVLDLRANYRIDKLLLVSVALENVLDAAYRYHGSSVNGPGRGLVTMLDLGPLWRL